MTDILWLSDIHCNDIDSVGGKNASLGEMYNSLTKNGINIPNAFVVTTMAYEKFIKHNNLLNYINDKLSNIDHSNIVSLQRNGLEIRNKIQNCDMPHDLVKQIMEAYKKLSNNYYNSNGIRQEITDVAVRSSATAEDLPDASFAGQQETYLNIRGNTNLCMAIKNCFSSLYTDRAISYRNKFNFNDVKLSVCVQKMVRSDLHSAGVAFSVDTETGFDNVIIINGSWGLGEHVVGGTVNPDEYIVFKNKLDKYCPIIDKTLGDKVTKIIYDNSPYSTTKEVLNSQRHKNNFCLTNEQIIELSKQVYIIEQYYSNIYNKKCYVDVEWAIDGLENKLYIVQARQETVHSRNHSNIISNYKIHKKPTAIIEGIAVGNNISHGTVKVLHTQDTRENICNFEKGDVLVTEMTDPDWEPIMKIAAGIVTNKGGRTCHASILARELGIPAVVGTQNATKILNNKQMVTVSCCEGETGFIYDGHMEYSKEDIKVNEFNKTKTKIMLNVGNPQSAFKYSFYPNEGVGLAREEFIIANFIKIHPLALLNIEKLDKSTQDIINDKIKGFKNGEDYYVNKLSYGIAKIAAAFYPKDVIIRFSDFKSNEYKNLIGGNYFEPEEENPMIGWRGASRYYSDKFKYAFGLECKAIIRVREIMGLDNVIVMIPFCRTVKECKLVLDTMKEFGLERGKNGLKVYLMCEIPSNVILAEEFAKYVDGYSIGSNDLTQTVLGVDRDSELVSSVYNERDDAVVHMIKSAIKSCKKTGIKIGICGQAPSDFPEFANMLVNNNIDSISVIPDTVCKMYLQVSKLEKKRK